MSGALTRIYRNENADTQQQDAAISKLIKDVDTYKDLLQKTETRLSKRVKELSSEVKSLVSHGIEVFDTYQLMGLFYW